MLYARRLRIPSRRSVEGLVRRAIGDIEAIDIKAVYGVILPEETASPYISCRNCTFDDAEQQMGCQINYLQFHYLYFELRITMLMTNLDR